MSCKRSALVVARKNAGFTQEELAARLGVDRATIGRWESGANEPLAWIRPKLARILGLSPAQLAKVLEVRSEVGPNRADLGDHNKRNYCYSDDVERWIAEVADTSVDDSRIEQISRATIAVAETHSAAPARRVLAEVLRLHDQICRLFGRPQRLRQKRELLRIDSDLLAHACVLFGDIKQNDMAEKYGLAALRCAAEAESSQAKPRTALAKTLRWQRRFVESMDLAILGFEHSPHSGSKFSSPVRKQMPRP
jgi:transcriptional regulator with XRE-family HTH domain